MAYITRESKKPEMLGDVGFTLGKELDEKPEYIKKKEKKKEWITKKKEKKEWISKKDKKNIVDTAKDAFNLLKKHYPKIGKDY